MKAYRSNFDYSVSIKAAGDYIAQKLPCSMDVFCSLSSLLKTDNQKPFLSDCFAQGFVYKPLSYDTARLCTREEYKLFKKIKSAKYEQLELIRQGFSVDSIPSLVADRRIKVRDGHIYSALFDFSLPFSKCIEPSSRDPIKIAIKKDGIMDFYISSETPIEHLCGKKIKLCDFDFDIVKIQKLERKYSQKYMLTATLETSFFDADFAGAEIFRLSYDKKEKKQYFSAGSIFSFDVFSQIEKLSASFLPFFLPV